MCELNKYYMQFMGGLSFEYLLLNGHFLQSVIIILF